ncbi:MAG TPA: thiamine phosphate synthase [Polyangiales bacterium]|nr:thiamine phosphate synthase [Polyangiales bacterium]
MSEPAPLFDLLLITPDRAPEPILEQARRALNAAGEQPGRVALQLRSKQLPARERAQLGAALCALCREQRATFLVNGDLALARALVADGVQLSESGPSLASARASLPTGVVGVSRHDAAGVRAAAGASFVLLGPVFAVPGKGPALGLQGFAALAELSPVPVVALGGIDAHNAGAVLAAGARALAVMREVFDATDPAQAVALLLRAANARAALLAAREPAS